MIRIQAALAGLLLAAASAAAETLTVVPPLDQALPWTDTPQGVRAAVPFLLNAATVVPAGAALRVFYVRPVAEVSDDGPKLIDKGANKEDAYSRNGAGVTAQDSAAKKTLSGVDAAVRSAHQTVWPTIASFRAAFALLGGTDLRLVYQEKEGAEISDQALAPVQGLILEEKDHAVVVCGIVQGSNAERAGIAVGDAVEAVNGAPVGGSLASFSALYQQTGAASTIAKPKPYVFGIRHPGAAAPVDVAIRPPPALGGSLLDQ